MRSLSKRKKRNKRLNVDQSDDRITNLPSCLITKILSGLPTKDAVATSVLSTKWKHSWMSITNLDFDDELTSRFYNADRDAPKYRRFTDFVTRVLLLRERSCLQKVRLSCYRHSDDTVFNTWLSHILLCKVQELDIFISISKEHPGLILPSELILCRTLVVLKLVTTGNVKIHIPASVCLPSLKTLHLYQVELKDDVSFSIFLSGCPVLEELKISEFLGDEVHVVNITSRVLKRLIIERLPWSDMKVEGYQIVIDTPALEYWYFCTNFAKIYVPKKMDHLIKAEIKLGFFYPARYEELVFFDAISSVQNLVISCGSVQVIRRCEIVLPTFDKLTYLKIDAGFNYGWRVLAKLLEKSPCLKTLYIQKRNCETPFEHGRGTLSFEDVPCCFRSHLKEIEYDYFENDYDEMEVVGYFLKNARVLEKFTLHYKLDHESEIGSDVVAILRLPRASAVCEIVVL